MGLLARWLRNDRTPRFRSGERTSATDRERLETIRAAIRGVIDAIDREEAGLRRRVDEAGARAASIADTVTDGYLHREPAEEARLVEAEAQLIGACRRLDDLKVQRHFFENSIDHFRDRQAPWPSQPVDPRLSTPLRPELGRA
ncbi:hypothetical protein [Phreatobacter sp.]|uniref:hypothetical protein n=1 Tax=Phreatobacter sp. TaxID=1966341 RepID=UPI003F72DA0A